MNITVRHKGDLSTEFILRERSFSIDSELHGPGLFTKISSENQIISIRKKEGISDTEQAIKEHAWIVEDIKKLILAENLGEYIKRTCELIERKRFNEALFLTREVRFFHPDDPYMMCLDGYLTALIEKKYRDGINLCIEALNIYTRKAGIGREFFLPFFYLHLGRTYLLSGNKRLAVDCFFKILKIDNDNKEAIKELACLGIRQQPVLPFLKRNNPLNKYLGLLRARLSGKRSKNKYQ